MGGGIIPERVAGSGRNPQPGLLHHFGSKDQLLLAMLNEVDAKDEAEVAAIFADELTKAANVETIREMFRRSLRIIAERSLARPELTRLRVVLRAAAINPDHPAHHYFAARHRAKLERLAKGAALFSSNPDSIARQVLAMWSGLEEQWLCEDRGFDVLTEWEQFVDRLLSSTRGSCSPMKVAAAVDLKKADDSRVLEPMTRPG